MEINKSTDCSQLLRFSYIMHLLIFNDSSMCIRRNLSTFPGALKCSCASTSLINLTTLLGPIPLISVLSIPGVPFLISASKLNSDLVNYILYHIHMDCQNHLLISIDFLAKSQSLLGLQVSINPAH